jgi:hypothetical protein
VTELERAGELAVRKSCVFCGSGPLTLAWRPLPDDVTDLLVTTPLDRSAWWPTTPALDARLSCASCGNLAYGRLVGGHVTEDGFADGHFVVMPGDWRPDLW